ncbi:bifunctional adenosylcobinamide kinase/adenosylcobinamide-phosphate guanylyltransferase [Virgibacillus byunsanensis]|uniref:Adenosylcobinamide kinase n=1 Tax=Virgibacillus byunsanensis TaxID=570945 RepID=A0ABW3LLI0_9BACI
MQLIIGGAFSGKRKVVRKQNEKCSWVSAYDGDAIIDWKTNWVKDTTLVMEGWEKWITTELKKNESNDEIRKKFSTFFQNLVEKEQKRENEVVLVMLEVGKGIVPLENNDRRLRDLAGWIAQDAAIMAGRVNYVWNGYAKRLK